jgi:hypothetical protein
MMLQLFVTWQYASASIHIFSENNAYKLMMLIEDLSNFLYTLLTNMQGGEQEIN